MKTTTHARGYLTVHRLRDGKRELIAEDVPNLILNGGIQGGTMYIGWMNTFKTHPASFPNKSVLEGTWSQNGNIITRESGTDIVPNPVSTTYGHQLKWEDGERCHIISRTSDTQLTVSGPPRTITGKVLTYYPTNAPTTGYAQSSVGSVVEEKDAEAGTLTAEATVTMDAATSDYICGSVFVGSNARIVLPEPLSVATLDQLQFSYRIVLTCAGREKRTVPMSEIISGWPVEYVTPSISGDGATITVTSTADHHFEAGDRIVIKDAVPMRAQVTNITADGGTWTITAAGHGLRASDSLEIEGCSITDYNGTFIVASVPDANTLTIANDTPLGIAANGTVRLTTPATYFDGEYIVATVPDTTSITIASAITGPAVDPESTILTSPDEAELVITGYPSSIYGNWIYSYVYDDTNEVPEPSPSDLKPNLTGLTAAHSGSDYNSPNRVSCSYTNDFVETASTQPDGNWSAGGADVLRVRNILLRTTSFSTAIGIPFWWIRFVTPQPKLSTHLLIPPNWSQQFLRELD